MKEMTLKQLADNLGVSIATVSRVLAGKAKDCRISKATEERILAEAKRCGFIPSVIAQNLRKRKSTTIGLIFPSSTNPFFAEITSAVIQEANSKGYTTIIVDNMEQESTQQSCITTLLSRRVSGIIACPSGNNSDIFAEVGQLTPVVLVDRYFDDVRIPYVTSNNYKGAYEATELLITNGHKNIACIQGATSSMPNKRRVQGFVDAAKKHGIREYAIVGDGFSIQNGYLEAKLLLNQEKRPTAIFALSYTILLGVLKAIHESNLSIPDDISIVSFDDHLSLDYMTPPITRVKQPVMEMGAFAFKILLNNIEGEGRQITQLELSTFLINRGSIKNLNLSGSVDAGTVDNSPMSTAQTAEFTIR